MIEPSAAGALAGIRVIDLSRVLGGPFCSQWLADHGADVIKIEPPQGDETRAWGPPFKAGTASYFLGVNRNKRGLALDLAQESGREVLLRLLEDADLLIENFKPGAMEKWGLGYQEILKARFPRLVHCRISGFGATGPLRGMPGYDAVVQAYAGLMSVNGDAGSGPMRMGIAVVDIATGISAGFGILMALLERERSGLGQYVDTSLFDTAISLLHPHAANWFLNGQTPTRTGNAHANVAPYDKFETGTCAIFLGIGNDRQFARLCAALGRPELARDSRFSSNAERSENRDHLRAELEGPLRGLDGAALCDRLLRDGVPAGPVLEVPEVLNHPQTREREMVVELDDYRGTGIPIKLSRTPGSVRRPPPEFGADGREILAEAGYSDAQIDSLIKAGVVLEKPRPPPS